MADGKSGVQTSLTGYLRRRSNEKKIAMDNKPDGPVEVIDLSSDDEQDQQSVVPVSGK